MAAAATAQYGNIRRLGNGGFGAVWLHRTPKAEFARKFFDDGDKKYEEFENVQRSMDAAFCRHGYTRGSANVVMPLHQSKLESDVHYIDYRLADGDLDTVAANASLYLPTMDAVHNLVLDCVCGLEFLHTKVKMTHNDIKCGNILISTSKGAMFASLAI